MTDDRYYWIGARDVEGIDTHVWIRTNQVLPNTSPMWVHGYPHHGSDDCVKLNKNGAVAWQTDYDCTSINLYVKPSEDRPEMLPKNTFLLA